MKLIALPLMCATTLTLAAGPQRSDHPRATLAPAGVPSVHAAPDAVRAQRAPAQPAPPAQPGGTRSSPPPPPAAPPATQAPRAGREVPPPPPPGPPPAGERRAIPTRNVKVDVTITDQTGTGAAMKKVVSLVVADGRSSSVRSMNQVLTQRRDTDTSVPINDFRNVPLNIDTYVSITAEQRVLLELKFNYGSVHRAARLTAVTAEAGPSPDVAYGEITENLWTLLNVGEPVVVSRSADASSDRTVTVEVKADILK